MCTTRGRGEEGRQGGRRGLASMKEIMRGKKKVERREGKGDTKGEEWRKRGREEGHAQGATWADVRLERL